MTDEEITQYLDELGARQTLDMFDLAAIRQVVQPHEMKTVVAATIAVRKRTPFVGADNLQAELDGATGSTAEAEWMAFKRDVIASGAMGRARVIRKPIDPDLFPSPKALDAYRQARFAIQNGSEQQGRRAFIDAYRSAPDMPPLAPALEAGGR